MSGNASYFAPVSIGGASGAATGAAMGATTGAATAAATGAAAAAVRRVRRRAAGAPLQRAICTKGRRAVANLMVDAIVHVFFMDAIVHVFF
jgi:hypothetical protein